MVLESGLELGNPRNFMNDIRSEICFFASKSLKPYHCCSNNTLTLKLHQVWTAANLSSIVIHVFQERTKRLPIYEFGYSRQLISQKLNFLMCLLQSTLSLRIHNYFIVLLVYNISDDIL
jgi:hypothetical protein